jgi:hypothetical protein
MDKKTYFAITKFFKVPPETARHYLDEARGHSELAWLAVLANHQNLERDKAMSNFYGAPTEKDLHRASLDEAEKMNDWVERYFDEHPQLDIKDPDVLERVQKIYIRNNQESGEILTKGYTTERETHDFGIDSYEAARQLDAKIKKLMREKKIPHDEAHAIVFSDGENEMLIKAYAFSD